eukprot:CAMPEP_0201517034 /NCGR_PEP_ID=MMETSP0161_2-20130828/8251_1 /ASSEMBLY_ACC=CAM_ASM_000251 /TAXON_ID=180227 /ORGANISM="Neoparamoeba aestuarina, Strain SoJaBio B1-5/56/2" /LENGTH=204 /DNA_ID=CAMNT_0047914419 /DNA_START=983 /DNA_END=1597 /DNA_ORIENTATION=-
MLQRNQLVEGDNAGFLRIQMTLLLFVRPRLCLAWAEALRQLGQEDKGTQQLIEGVTFCRTNFAPLRSPTPPPSSPSQPPMHHPPTSPPAHRQPHAHSPTSSNCCPATHPSNHSLPTQQDWTNLETAWGVWLLSLKEETEVEKEQKEGNRSFSSPSISISSSSSPSTPSPVTPTSSSLRNGFTESLLPLDMLTPRKLKHLASHMV